MRRKQKRPLTQRQRDKIEKEQRRKEAAEAAKQQVWCRRVEYAAIEALVIALQPLSEAMRTRVVEHAQSIIAAQSDSNFGCGRYESLLAMMAHAGAPGVAKSLRCK